MQVYRIGSSPTTVERGAPASRNATRAGSD
jgi:hypothetical protein